MDDVVYEAEIVLCDINKLLLHLNLQEFSNSGFEAVRKCLSCLLEEF